MIMAVWLLMSELGRPAVDRTIFDYTFDSMGLILSGLCPAIGCLDTLLLIFMELVSLVQ